jgi:acyl carrier protein
MGLDAVELALAIEETFGIDLPDADTAKLTTPRKLIDHVCARVGAAPAK